MKRKTWLLTLAPLALLFLNLLALPGRGVSAADEKWRARYYNNRDASGDPVLRRDEAALDHDWGGGSPGGGVRSDDFSARWTRTVALNAAVYRFCATMDDGMRVWIDGALVMDEWRDSQVRTVCADLPMTAGEHAFEVRYYEAGGQAVAKFWWSPTGVPPGRPPSAGPSALWQGYYFNNQYLGGPPAFTRADDAIDFNWRLGSPWPTLPHDHFSVRWTGRFQHTAGRYHFRVLTDDGVRLWVNDLLLIDEWHDNQSVTYEAFTDLPGGSVPLRLDYYENTGAARITLSAEIIDAPGSPGGPTVAPPPTGVPPGSAVVTARYLNLRSSPQNVGRENVIGFLQGGQIVQPIGRSGGWVQVRLPDGRTGWVGGSYLSSSVPTAGLP